MEKVIELHFWKSTDLTEIEPSQRYYFSQNNKHMVCHFRNKQMK